MNTEQKREINRMRDVLHLALKTGNYLGAFQNKAQKKGNQHNLYWELPEGYTLSESAGLLKAGHQIGINDYDRIFTVLGIYDGPELSEEQAEIVNKFTILCEQLKSRCEFDFLLENSKQGPTITFYYEPKDGDSNFYEVICDIPNNNAGFYVREMPIIEEHVKNSVTMLKRVVILLQL